MSFKLRLKGLLYVISPTLIIAYGILKLKHKLRTIFSQFQRSEQKSSSLLEDRSFSN